MEKRVLVRVLAVAMAAVILFGSAAEVTELGG